MKNYEMRERPMWKATGKKPVKPWVVECKMHSPYFPKWNEWFPHSRYATKRDALKGIKDLVRKALPHHWEYRLVEPEREKKK